MVGPYLLSSYLGVEGFYIYRLDKLARDKLLAIGNNNYSYRQIDFTVYIA